MKRIGIILILFTFISSFALANEVNVFSARHYDSDIQLYEKFTGKTGIKVLKNYLQQPKLQPRRLNI